MPRRLRSPTTLPLNFLGTVIVDRTGVDGASGAGTSGVAAFTATLVLMTFAVLCFFFFASAEPPRIRPAVVQRVKARMPMTATRRLVVRGRPIVTAPASPR